MPADLGYLWIPLLGCLVLTGIHAYLGIHVLSRGVIFVDLALAQIAALGAATALYLGMEPGTGGSYAFSLAFTTLAAGLFSLTRVPRSLVPQEAIIGIVYAVASAASVIVMAVTPDAHGVEKIRAILVGRSIVWVSGHVVLRTALIYAAVAAFHFVFRRQFLAASLDPEGARAKGLRLGLWDFLFYATFGLVITSSVQIAGVLLVFSFLIVPAVIGALLGRRLRSRLLIGWTSGTVASFAGLLLSYELPSGPVIVVTFGALLVLAGLVWAVRSAADRAVVLRRFAVAGAVGLVLVVMLRAVPWRRWFAPAAGAHAHASRAEAGIDALLASRAPLDREKALDELRAHPDWPLPAGLLDAVRRETHPDLKTHLAEQGLQRGDVRFVGPLVEHVLSLASPFYLEEAIGVLARFTDFDPGPEDAERTARVRRWWQAARHHLVWDPARRRFVTR